MDKQQDTPQSTSATADPKQPMFVDPLMEKVSKANNLPEMLECHRELLASQVYPPQAYQILCSKLINLAAKFAGFSDGLKKQIQELSPQALSAEDRAAIEESVADSPLEMVRKMVLDLPPSPHKMPALKTMALSLVMRVDRLEQQSMHSQTSSENFKAAEYEIGRLQESVRGLELSLLRVEIERNTMVEALRIAVSHGAINPVDEGRIQQDAGSSDQRARG